MTRPRKAQDLLRAAKGTNNAGTFLRRWQAMLIRNRGQVLGTVEARDEETAKQAAAERYGLTDQQLARLALRDMRTIRPYA